MNVIDAITGRASVRAYLDRPVSRETVAAILDAARWSPSGVNTQPWRVVAVSGETKRRLGERLSAARLAGQEERPDYRYYPAEWVEPYRGRRRACGLALYQAQGIGRDDHDKRLASWVANYRFFDAPVGLLLFMDRSMGQGSWLDMGMFMQSIMLAARGFGLSTCPQASLAEYADLVREVVGVGDNQLLLGGIALGYADESAPVNGYRTEREPVEAFTTFLE